MAAYFGHQKNYTYIYECINDPEIKSKVEKAMVCVGKALAKKYNLQSEKIQDDVDDLLFRFSNTKLADTIERVGIDPIRKLGKDDRLIGAALFCELQGVDSSSLIDGIIAALKYDNLNDEYATTLRELIEKDGVEQYLENYCGMDRRMDLTNEIVRRFNSDK